jgi:hypothetical protein
VLLRPLLLLLLWEMLEGWLRAAPVPSPAPGPACPQTRAAPAALWQSCAGRGLPPSSRPAGPASQQGAPPVLQLHAQLLPALDLPCLLPLAQCSPEHTAPLPAATVPPSNAAQAGQGLPCYAPAQSWPPLLVWRRAGSPAAAQVGGCPASLASPGTTGRRQWPPHSRCLPWARWWGRRA